MKKQITEEMIDDADLYDSETTELLRAEDLRIVINCLLVGIAKSYYQRPRRSRRIDANLVAVSLEYGAVLFV